MFDNDKLYFSAKNEAYKVKEIILEYERCIDGDDVGKAKQIFQKLAKVMRERTCERYFRPIKIFLHNCGEHPEQSGFIVMGINCILIELYFQLINGFDTSTEGKNTTKEAYSVVLPMIDPAVSLELAGVFYKGIRCKIIHQGQTGELTAISFATEVKNVISLNGGYYLCNPRVLFDGLSKLYQQYWKELSEGKDNAQKEKLIKKMKHILRESDTKC